MKLDSIADSRLARTALTVLLTIPVLLAACSQKSGDDQAKGTLRVAYSNEQSFQYQYGDYFAVKFPDVEVQIVPTEGLYGPGKNYAEEFEKLIREQKPDLLITYSGDYDKWAAKGLLLDLEPFVRKSKFDLDSFTPAAIAQLKANGEGKLFGLAPELTSYALYYNKDLFDQYGVPYPTNKMSWNDTMQLARRFPVDPDPAKRIYGIHEKYSTPFDFVNDIAGTENAAYMSPDGKKMTLDSDVWKKAFRQVLDGFRSGNLYYYYKDGKRVNYGPEETKQMDLFSSGKAAMMISGTEQMFRMKQWGEGSLNWDIVTVPVDPANPDFTRYFNVNPIYAISANAQHAETAWKVVQYFNGEEAAKVSQKTSDVLSTRTAFAKTKDGRNLEPFYMLKRRTPEPVDYTPPATFYAKFHTPFEALVIRAMDDAVKGRLTDEEAVRVIQAEGQALLDQAWTEEAARSK
ncbi:extracellular solute-binding protein [Paenibacillus hemerocallicola]|uniref:Extracellular solute-binding protein n=1 Tax=Paenibacillus hemerocallicola TaxID=1172614 RepID=A0A5C4T8C0_9BACL|nr:extracellular solute-binding protein [Paenibacillus hemerocallicola]TNJ65036.1 extracellular solute-binding protein [Paenibacillus hemerocallicola]